MPFWQSANGAIFSGLMPQQSLSRIAWQSEVGDSALDDIGTFEADVRPLLVRNFDSYVHFRFALTA